MSKISLEGKKVFVTGSSYGIGLGFAKSLLKAGAKVAINSRKKQEETVYDELCELGDCHYVQADLSSSKTAREAVQSAYEKLDGLDCLINNAGTFADVEFENLEDEHFDRTFNLNVRGYIFTSQEFVKLVGKREFDAGIIHVGSTNSLQAEDGSVIYDCSKGAILMMIRSMAVSLAKKGIRCNGIGPGFVETPLTGGAIQNSPSIVDLLSAQIPEGRIGQIDDLGGTAVFLASDASKYVNGQMIYVDGGILSQQMVWEFPEKPST